MHVSVQEGGGEEVKAFGGRGGKVGDLREFSAYGLTLEMVLSFKYLGRVLLAVDDHWPAVIQNLKKARAVWRQMPRILIREGARPRVYGFYSKPSSSQCCSLVRRHGWLPPTWDGYWGVSKNMWHVK